MTVCFSSWHTLGQELWWLCHTRGCAVSSGGENDHWLTKIISLLPSDKILGNFSTAQAEAIKSKKRIVKMFVFMIILFGICWLPYNIYFLYVFHDPKFMQKPYTKNLYLFFYWLAMANSCINPFIYYNLNGRWLILTVIHGLWLNLSYRFKKHFREVFLQASGFFLWCFGIKIETTEETFQVIE